MRALTPTLFAAACLLLAACASPATLQPDFGDCYRAAFTAQADLDRPAAVDLAYPLDGVEALEIRAQVAKKAADEATAIPLLIGAPAR